MYEGWRNNPAAFIEYIGLPPTADNETSVDRYPNKDGNYEPGNVRWATSKMQNRNSRKNFMVTAFGECLCAAEWAERTGLGESIIRHRIKKQRLSPEEALTTPPYGRQRAFRLARSGDSQALLL